MSTSTLGMHNKQIMKP